MDKLKTFTDQFEFQMTSIPCYHYTLSKALVIHHCVLIKSHLLENIIKSTWIASSLHRTSGYWRPFKSNGYQYLQASLVDYWHPL